MSFLGKSGSKTENCVHLHGEREEQVYLTRSHVGSETAPQTCRSLLDPLYQLVPRHMCPGNRRGMQAAGESLTLKQVVR